MTEKIRRALGDGSVLGLRDRGVSRFSGLRYARAPTGALRFAPPLPLAVEGVVDATRHGPLAPQGRSLLADVLGDTDAPQSEDCLHLTVWTSAGDEAEPARRPVIVWLHGGALQTGGNALGWYDGADLSRRGDVVVVSVNYRLGVLGWLCPTGGTANLGLLDQAAALAWVRHHIAELGGDADRITVMGQSAGGLCAAALLAQDTAPRRLILQSAPLGRRPRNLEAAHAIGDALIGAAGANGLDAARRLPLAQLMQAQQAPGVRDALAAIDDGQGLAALVAGGAMLPSGLQLESLAGRADVLIGTTRHEMAAFTSHRAAPETQRMGDALFAAPARRWAQAATAAGRQAWQYRFDFAPTDRFGACHCIELPFVFGTWPAFAGAPMLRGVDPQAARRLTHEVQQAWLAFARDEALAWPPGPPVHLFH
jgi:para-nitrobenzyl esterase